MNLILSTTLFLAVTSTCAAVKAVNPDSESIELHRLLSAHHKSTHFKSTVVNIKERHLQGPPGGGPPGGGPPGGGGLETFTCAATPCSVPSLGDVGLTTTSGTNVRTSKSFSPGENIYGPFEAGFTNAQDSILALLGCTTGKGYIRSGIDTLTAESVVAADCSIVLPRIDGSSQYISLLDECGGHTGEYHFHERLSCLYAHDGSGAHSSQVGEGLVDDQLLYGKWEDETAGDLPLLDACGGHFGFTPDSPSTKVYHYHVQDRPPFTWGCYGPNAEGGLVTIAECRELYDECGNGDKVTFTVADNDIMGYSHPTTIEYDPWCPCFDRTGSNVGTEELTAFDTAWSSACNLYPDDEAELIVLASGSMFASAEWKAFTTCSQVAANDGCYANWLKDGYIPGGSVCICTCTFCMHNPDDVKCGGEGAPGAPPSPSPGAPSSPSPGAPSSPSEPINSELPFGSCGKNMIHIAVVAIIGLVVSLSAL